LGLTKTGLSKGLAQLTRYVLEARKLCPSCGIEATLHFYRVFTGVYYDVREGDNLSTIAKDNNVSLKQLYLLNPDIDKKTNLIKPGQKLLLDVIKKKGKTIQDVKDEELKQMEKVKDKTRVQINP